MKKEIQNCFVWLANSLSESNIYNWGKDTKLRENSNRFEIFYNELKKYLDFNSLTVEEAKELHFGKWEEESDLWLFPLYLVPLIPEGLEVTSIGGEKYKYKKEEADNDIRYGCVAYGIEIKE